ncbi:MAG: hypothetical protein E4H15_01585 [Syntrophobacterales bacterium]|nr:MAG: hypothetical protein E4H15_01585 [Syntrophobacterales bacterium]
MDEDTRTLTKDDKIYDLVDVVEEDPEGILQADPLDDEIAGVVSKIAERIAREMFPSIAERIIREEIERLKENPGK